jgi:hypothetical protein
VVIILKIRWVWHAAVIIEATDGKTGWKTQREDVTWENNIKIDAKEIVQGCGLVSTDAG